MSPAACEAARRALDALGDGADPLAVAAADRHADACPACSRHREEVYRRLADEADEAELAPVPAGLEERLLGKVRTHRRGRQMRWAAVALGMVVAMTGTVAFTRSESEAARRREAAVRRNEAIERLIRQDRALLASDPMSGSPAFSFASSHP